MYARLLISVMVLWPVAGQTPSTWTPELSMKVKNVGDVTASPDGSMVVWTQTTAVMDAEKSEMNTQVFLAHADGSGRIQLTRGEKSSEAAEFSPDGRWVLFASERTGKRNIHRIPVDGGEAEQISHWTGAMGAFHISPDGKWVAFTGREADPDEERARHEKRDFHVIDENPHDFALWVLPVEPDIHGRRTVRKLAAGPYHIGGFEWSPDSRYIAYETRPTPNADDGRLADISEVELETGTVRVVADTKATESQPRYSPDGRYLAYVRSNEATGSRVTGSRIVLYARATGKLRELPPTSDESPALDEWAKDSSKIYFTEPLGTRAAIYVMPTDGPPSIAWRPSRGTFGFGVRMNQDGTHAGFAFQTPDDPPEAYVLALSSTTPVRVSAANVDLAKPALGKTEVVRWKAKDGKEIEGVLTLPVNYEKGKKVPLVVNIHGGPAGAFGESFIGGASLYPIAAFASKGYAVLRPNPRGSTGYGLAFRAANVDDWGGGDYNDIMAGVDYLISQGIADPERMAVMGWSYGGYMTDWVITQTSRFKCAASGAGLSDLISMWGTNDIPSTLDDYFDGTWYEQPDRYVRMSPLYHVKNVTTPTLFLHGEIDPRVPTTQGYEMYHALKQRGVETEMVVYPRTQHGPREPKFVLDIMHRHLDWVAKHLGN